jgi:hypothetical protein
VRASTNAPKNTTRLDAGKESPGRKRGLATDVLGQLIAVVVVVAASVHNNAIGIALLDKAAASAPVVTKGWVEAGCKWAVVTSAISSSPRTPPPMVYTGTVRSEGPCGEVEPVAYVIRPQRSPARLPPPGLGGLADQTHRL